jgi:hypothetical protein
MGIMPNSALNKWHPKALKTYLTKKNCSQVSFYKKNKLNLTLGSNFAATRVFFWQNRASFMILKIYECKRFLGFGTNFFLNPEIKHDLGILPNSALQKWPPKALKRQIAYITQKNWFTIFILQKE